MIIEIIKAITLAGLPIAGFSYYLIMLTKKKASLKATNVSQLRKELKTIELDKDPEETMVENALQKKFLRFGGGFYGVVTLMTYIHIEGYQVLQFIGGLFGEGESVFNDGIVSLIIAFFIEMIINLITAFMWPVYWSDYLPIGIFWIWLIIAMISHTIATKHALSKRL